MMNPDASSSPSLRPSRTEALGTQHPGRSLTRAAVYGWLGFAFLLFLLETLPYLSCRWMGDESWYSATGYSMSHGGAIAVPAMGPNELENHFDARPPGTAIEIAAAFRLLGTGPIPARLGSILAGLAIIFFTYRLAHDIIGEEGALVAVFVVATDNLIVLTSRSARPEALTAMAVLASLLAMKRYARTGGALWAFLSGFLIAMGTMFHVTLLGNIVSFGILAIVLDHRSGRFPLRGASGYALGYSLGLLPYAAWLMTAPLGGAGFREEFVGKAEGASLWVKILLEGHRYYDLLGVNMLHGHGFNMLPGYGLESIPIRLPIPLFSLAASFLLWRLRRPWFHLELLLLLPSLFWFIYLMNKTSRYFALLAPIFALVIGAAVTATAANQKAHRVLLVLSCLLIAAQISANLLLLHAAREADYNKVTAELRSVIPSGQTAYGSVTFWLALHDRPFISNERTDPWMAANLFHARYFITGDRVVILGVPGEKAHSESLNRTLAQVIAQSKLVGHFPDSFYGDLKVYELREP